jgi:hypothetical protein
MLRFGFLLTRLERFLALSTAEQFHGIIFSHRPSVVSTMDSTLMRPKDSVNEEDSLLYLVRDLVRNTDFDLQELYCTAMV